MVLTISHSSDSGDRPRADSNMRSTNHLNLVASTKISVVINTLNEEDNIADCIRSIHGLADEILVCDMHSEDKTVEIATSYGARVVDHQLARFVEPARKYAISQAAYEWVLVLDADERMTERLANRLKKVATNNEADCVSFWSLYWYFGEWVRHGGFFTGNHARFFKKQIYMETYEPSEELLHKNFHRLLNHQGILRLPEDLYILHIAYPTIEKYVSKTLGLYARINAEQLIRSGRRFSLVSLLGEPLKVFIDKFVIQHGYRDGLRGLILSALYSGYRFTTWSNVWFLEEVKEGEATEIPPKPDY